MLGPSPLNTGARFKNPTKDDFVYAPSASYLKFRPSSWELRPEMFLVDGVTNLPGVPYKLKRMFVDGIYQRVQMSNIWDATGKIWKQFIFFTGDTGLRYKGHKCPDLTGMCCADLQKDYHSNVDFHNAFGNMKFTLNAGTSIEDTITPSAMLRNAVR
jgi:hypothetical protein